MENKIVKIKYGNNVDYGFVIRSIDSGELKGTHVVSTQAYPLGQYIQENFLEFTDSKEALNYVKEKVIPLYENSSWIGYIPENVDPVQFFAEMAEIYPGTNEKNKPVKVPFHCCVYEANEGPVPHVHLYYGRKNQKYDDHHNLVISFVCLHTNEYAPQHANETKILSPKETEVLETFFSSMIDTYRKDDNGNIYQLNAWMDAVFRWLKQNPTAKKYFKFDNNGIPIMPDYSRIKMPSKENRKEFEGMNFRY